MGHIAEMLLSCLNPIMQHYSSLKCHFAVAFVALFGSALWPRSAGLGLGCAFGSTALDQAVPEGLIRERGMACSAAQRLPSHDAALRRGLVS